MSIAIRQAILDEVLRRLETIPGVAEVEINPPGDPSRFDAIYVDEVDQQADDTVQPGSTEYELDLSIEGYVEGGSGKVATAKRSALYLNVVEALLPEPPLGGLAEEISEDEMQLATVTLSDKRRLGFSLRIKIKFFGDRESPSTEI